MAFAAAFLVILLAAPCAFATDSTVTWGLGNDYSSWATKPFVAGDSLVFNYDNTLHNVEVVSKSDYDNCVSSGALQTFKDGKTTITLKEGPMYFICGTAGHCQGGMKLQVSAKASGSATPSTPSTPSSTPTPSGSGSTTPTSSSTPSAPSPKSSNGASGLSGATHLIVGVPLVLGALFAFMG